MDNHYPPQPPTHQPYPAPFHSQPPKIPAWRWVVPFAAVGVAAIAVMVASMLPSGDGGDMSTTSWVSSETSLEAAHDTCSAGTLADDGHTLILDMEGEEYGSGTASYDDVVCVLTQLDAPESVTSRMGSTRALDGMQEVSWESASASWTYHPDDGLDLIITDE